MAAIACAPIGGDDAQLSLDGDGASLPPAVAGGVLAEVEVQVPDEPRFVLRATVPLPKGLHGGAKGAAQLGFLQPDGTAMPAQIETAMRYPKEADGASVVELLARVDKPAGLAEGARATYPVVVLDEPVAEPVVPADPVQALVQGPLDLAGAVSTLLTTPQSLVVLSHDAFGHEYRFDLLGAGATKRVLKHGHHHAQIKTAGSLKPVSPTGGSQGTLPHLAGVQAYIGTWSGESVVTVDLRFHNGHVGDGGIDALLDLYFEQLELRVPQGFSVLQAFPDPKSGATTTSGGYTRWSVVTPEPGGKLHILPRQSQFHRRLAVCPTAAVGRARELLECQGLGFVRRGHDGAGNDLYSWWNPGTARWFPQSFQLPSLEHVGHATLRAQLTAQLQQYAAAMANGSSIGAYPIESGRLGWAHPYGTSYGGMTGGVGIHLVDGVRIVEAASIEGVRLEQLSHRMNSDRQRNVLFRADGEPTTVEDWLVPTPVAHVPFSFYMWPTGSTDPFKLKQAPTFQNTAVASQNRQPSYQATLLGFQAHDLQHLIRYTSHAKVLAWVANDSLAKDDLTTQAELARLSYHQYANASNGYVDGTGLRADMDFTEVWPGRGLDVGRAEGWAVDTVAAAYAIGSDAARAAYFPWFKKVALTYSDGVAPCSGHLMARTSSKMLDGKYRGAQAYEEAILYNALLGAVETVFRGKSAPHVAMLQDVLAGGYQSLIGPLKWTNSPLPGPRNIYGIGPKNVVHGTWCSAGSQPSDAYVTTVDLYQSWSVFGYAYDQTANGIYLTRAGQMVGGNLLTELLAAGANNVENRAALLAVVQRLNGLL